MSDTRPNTRSCHGCNQKKVRCDKCMPCSACSRSGRSCVFPSPGPRKRRTKKTIMQEMASRLSSLENTVRTGSDSKAHGHASPASSSPSAVHTAALSIHRSVPDSGDSGDSGDNDDDCPKHQDVDVFIGKDSSSQYFNEVLLSRVMNQERDIQSVLLSDSNSRAAEAPEASPFSALGILSAPSPTESPASFHPSQPLAVRLWGIFKENVEGCSSSKVLHHPTDDVRVYATIDKPAAAPLDTLALCYAIYYAAIASLDDVGVRSLQVLGDKQAHMFAFKSGLEQSLAHGDFLDRPSLTGLTALTIYLTALRTHNRGKGIWILNGLAIRIAQSLGLHRDGQYLPISPFEAEIRRRLWWHLLSRYGRSGEDYGLENIDGLLTRSTVHLPLNVEDQDLRPDMREPPPERDACTPMTLTLITIDLAVSAQKLTTTAIAASSRLYDPSLSSSTNSAVAELSEEVRIRSVNEIRERIDQLTRNCNPVVPQHRMTLMCARFLVRKFDFVTRMQWALLRQHRAASTKDQKDRSDFATDKNLAEAIQILQPRLFSDDGMLQQYAWARRAFPQYYIIMYILWHLCVKPAGVHVDRAWSAVNSAFSVELLDDSTVGYGSKMAVLMALRAKALAMRAQVQGGTQITELRGRASAASEGNPGNVAIVGAVAESFDNGISGLVQDGAGLDTMSGDTSPVHEALSFYLLGDVNSEFLNFDMENFMWSGPDSRGT